MKSQNALGRLAMFALVLPVAIALLAGSAAAQDKLELGKMWTFEHVPRDYFEKEHGFKLTNEWLDAVRMASLRFGGGCSASFVSPNGLVMTNHHCARDDIAKASPPGEDWVKNGYVAHKLEDEVKLEGLTVQQLVEMIDITEKMNEGISDNDAVEDISSKRAANEKKIMAWAAKEKDGLTARVVKLYQGGNYQLYLYRVYTDVRLVVAPHLQTAHFGGDPDNFTYPRYGIDFTFCRAYEDGKPADTSANFFKFNPDGPAKGESVFVTGSPGSTQRLLTHAQLEYLRDVEHPIILEIIDTQLASWKKTVEQNPAAEEQLRPMILRYENGQKAYRGYYGGVKDAELMAKKLKGEKELRAKVAADPELQRKYGSAWDELEKIANEKRKLEPSRRFHRAMRIPAITRAMNILDSADAALSDKDRQRAAGNATKGRFGMSPRAIEGTAGQIARAAKWLGEDDAFVKALLRGKEPAEGLKSLFDESRLGDVEYVTTLVDGGADAIAKSDDVALVAARALKTAIKHREERLPAIIAAEEVHKARIGQALYAIYGNRVSPDATGTLRLSDGKVKGFPCNGTIAPPWTTFYGLYGRNVEFDNTYPFDLPKPWLERRDKIDLSKPVDFVATNDIIGGNSGSPVINQKLEAVGLVFDGNIEMLANKFLYRDDIPRSVNVHTAAIMEAMEKIYGAKRVIKELMGK